MSTSCNGCRAPIEWITTARGRAMPLDAAPTTTKDPAAVLYALDGRLVGGGLGEARTGHGPHWATCPAADRFRLPRQMALRSQDVDRIRQRVALMITTHPELMARGTWALEATGHCTQLLDALQICFAFIADVPAQFAPYEALVARVEAQLEPDQAMSDLLHGDALIEDAVRAIQALQKAPT